MNFIEKVIKVQAELKAPKNQFNNFGKYKYRSCEDILEAAKPLCCENGLLLTVSDEVVLIGERFYVKATATITDGENSTHATALAREAATKKGMDDAQVTGSASSYARKYCLNGLLCIDDTKDSDYTNTHGKKPSSSKPAAKKAADSKPAQPKVSAQEIKRAREYIEDSVGKGYYNQIKKIYGINGSPSPRDKEAFGMALVAIYSAKNVPKDIPRPPSSSADQWDMDLDYMQEKFGILISENGKGKQDDSF